jgi:hypothetical protein
MVIRDPRELDGLRVLPGLRTPGLGRIHLAPAEGLDADAKGDFERRLNKLYFACGCDAAALFVALGFLVYLGWIGFGDSDRSGLRPWALGLFVVVIAAALGKFVGRLRADREFRQTVAELKRAWKVLPRTGERVAGCG